MVKRRATGSASSSRLRPTQIEALARAVPLSALHPAALAEIRAVPPDEFVALACSGGADSVALLLLLWAHFPERRGHWLVLHFDHRLRGRASTADAAFVRRVARTLGEASVTRAWSDAPAKASEARAREVRWGFFNEAMHAAGVRVIALGHQANDVAETMLMRLIRGSGTSGLAAPRPVQRMGDGSSRVRPLLDLPADEIRSALRRAKIRWREDASNATDDFLRNRIRRRVLPALVSATERDALAAIGDARALLEEDDAALDAWLDELIANSSRSTAGIVAVLRGRPRALARRAVHRWWHEMRIETPPNKSAIEALSDAIIKGEDRQISAGPGRWLVLQAGKLRLVEAAAPVPVWPLGRLEPGGELVGPQGDRLRARWVRLTPRLRARIVAGGFPHDEVAHLCPPPDWSGWFHVRAWSPGDRYRPLGAPGSRKVQDLFVDRRVPRERRPALPVVVMSTGNLAWIPGLPVADTVGIQPSAKLVVQLTYAGPPPMVHRPIDPLSYDV